MSVDVAVVGAGPVGCVAALAFARRGARVLLLEGAPEAARRRLAGELLHPAALRAMAQVGLELPPPSHGPTRGFAVFAPGRSQTLRYAQGEARTLPFHALVDQLRQAAADAPGITLETGVRVTRLEGHTLTLSSRGAERTVLAERILCADGRNSLGRRTLGLESGLERLSQMAGLLLRGIDLPYEGHGHVVLGKFGPALVYRITDDLVRVCLDVPSAWANRPDLRALLHQAYDQAWPEALRGPMRAALAEGPLEWAANGLRARTSYGKPPIYLLGDAVGVVHPMTAAGMSLGFADAVQLAEVPDFARWQQLRRRESQVPALLATALYEIFAVQSAPTCALREAVFDLWEADDRLRAVTMGFLANEDRSWARLLQVGSQLVARASVRLGRDAAHRGALRGVIDDWSRVLGLVTWLLQDAVPPSMQVLGLRTPSTPFAAQRARQDLLASSSGVA